MTRAALPGFHSPAAGFDQPLALLEACHERVLRSLDLLDRLVVHIDANGHDASSRSAAQDVLRYFSLAAPLHHQDEELHLFPLLLHEGDGPVVAAVHRLQEDHRAMEQLWSEIHPTLALWAADGTAAVEAPARRAIAAFRALYPDHIATEESLVYPAAFARLDTHAKTRIGQEMQVRRRVGHNAAPAQ